MKKIVMFLIMITSLTNVFAQNEVWESISYEEYLADMKSQTNQLSPNDSYSFQTVYKVFKNYVDDEPISVIQGESICRNGKEFMVDQHSFITLQNEQINIKIDKEDKTIYLLNLDTNFYRSLNFNEIATQPSEIKEIHRKKKTFGQSYQIILTSNPSYSAVELAFDENKSLKKTTLFSNILSPNEGASISDAQKPRIEIEIHNFKVNKEAQLSRLLLPSDVILKKNGEWKAQREYQEYKIINLIH